MTAHQLFKSLTEEYYAEAERAKKEKRWVGWSTSSFPCEIPEALSLPVLYPENHAAMLSSKKEAPRFLAEAEREGYSNDLCSYARINLGYIHSFDSAERNLVRPDFLLCATNTCHQVLKWFSLLSREFQIPLFLLDVPYQIKGEPEEKKIRYLREQAQEILESLARLSGQSYSPAKMEEVMAVSRENGKLWQEILSLSKNRPSPINGFDLFVYMSAIVTMKAKKETTVFLTALKEEIQSRLEKQNSDFPGKEQHRILFEGVCCWPCLYEMQLPLIRHQINVVGGEYLRLFGLVYTDFDDMLKAYASIPNAMGIDASLSLRKELVNDLHPEGVLFNLTRSCRIWCGYYFALERDIRRETSAETLIIDSDQADSRNFSFAQYETRVEALSEMLEEKENG